MKKHFCRHSGNVLLNEIVFCLSVHPTITPVATLFFLFVLTATLAENDVRLKVYVDPNYAGSNGLKATPDAALHLILFRVYTSSNITHLKKTYNISFRSDTEVFTLQDRDRFMLREEPNHFNGNQFYTGAVKFAQVSRKDFGHYTLCVCPIKSEADSDTFCSSNECEILGFDFIDESESTCAQTESQHCSSSLLGYSSVKHHLSGTLEKIAALSELVSQQSDDSKTFMENMDPGCRILLQIAPCFIALPKCKQLENETVELKHMCKQDCSAIFDVCKTWLEVSERKQNCIFKDFAKNMSQVLETLNLGREFNKSMCQFYNDSECISINATVLKNKLDENKTSHCYDSDYKGTSYRGQISKSISGMSCVKWDQSGKYDDLQGYSLNTIKYAELYGSENFCRNPINVTTQSIDQSKPWCFVDYQGTWEQCNVPVCHSANLNPIVFACIVVAASILAAVAFTFLLLLMKCVFSTKQQQPQHYLYIEDESGLRHFDRNQLETLSRLGEGEFGVVFKALIKRRMDDDLIVAVKALHEDADNTEQEHFRSEAKMLNEFDHENIIKLYGVCFEGEPMYMIFEYMPNGDLHDFLRQRAPSDGELSQLLSISVQIARGLAYLAEKRYIHRDIAARNVLLGSKSEDNILPAKLCDFGLSRSVRVGDYYRLKGKSMLPVRWMPPEAILYMTFTAASDVYSFGVLLWEVFSFGSQPYENVPNEDVVDHILQQQLLEQPIGCPDALYGIMKQCWKYRSNQRPSAYALSEELLHVANSCNLMFPQATRNWYVNAEAIAKHHQVSFC